MATIKKSSTRLARREARREARNPKVISGKSTPLKVDTTPVKVTRADTGGPAPKVSQAGVGPSSNYAERQGTGTASKAPNSFPKATPAETKAPAAAEESFGQAFARERKAGAKTFTYKGKSYTTETKEESAAKKSATASKSTPVKEAPKPYSTSSAAKNSGAYNPKNVGSSKSPAERSFKMTGGPESVKGEIAPKSVAKKSTVGQQGPTMKAKCGTTMKKSKKK